MREGLVRIAAAAMAAGAIESGMNEAHAGEAVSKPEAAHELRLEESGVYQSGDAAYQELLGKLSSGEYRVSADTTPPPVAFSGDRGAIDQLMRVQGLTLTETGIHSVKGEQQSNEWAVVITDQKGSLIGETQAVNISADGSKLKIRLMNTDGSLDLVVYENGMVTTAKHLVLE